MKRIYALALIIFAFSACGKDEPKHNDEPIAKSEFTSDKDLKSFFREQTNPNFRITSPKAKLYREFISADEIESTRQHLWALWQDANKERAIKHGFAWEKLTEYGFILSDYYGENAQTRGIEPVWEIPQGERMKAKLFLKGEEAKGTAYPTFINLHGGGKDPSAKTPWGSDQINEEQYSASISLSREWIDAPAFYIVPRMADDRKGRWSYQPQEEAFKQAVQLSWCSGLGKAKETYLLGISQGGYGTLRLAQFMPDYFSAVAPLDASEEITAKIQNLRHLPMRMKVGENDYKYGRVQFAYKWQEKWQKLQNQNPNEFIGEVVIEEGKEHGNLNYTDVTPWLKQYQRKSYPKHLTYVFHNIAPTEGSSGCFSKGVYYLDFRQLKTSSPKDEMLFDIVKEGNQYNIKTKTLQGEVKGKFVLYLDEIDYTKPIKVSLNGRNIWQATVRPSRGIMAESLALWGDPLRIFPAKVNIQLP